MTDVLIQFLEHQNCTHRNAHHETTRHRCHKIPIRQFKTNITSTIGGGVGRIHQHPRTSYFEGWINALKSHLQGWL